ncbi:MAG: prealbumin-like fold domain-containing protein, partial [Candidatus Aenigmatarchaeota archaeon]|nr:prealbumin-like fold domain-containing protein [Candidatus Aenigmarchaeota archaeon]
MHYLRDLQSGIYNLARRANNYFNEHKEQFYRAISVLSVVAAIGLSLTLCMTPSTPSPNPTTTSTTTPTITTVITTTPSPTASCGYLKIFKFYDSNGNGVWEEGEEPFPGIGFEIQYPDGHKEKFYTGEDGYVLLKSLPFGKYRIRELLPDGWEVTTPEEVEVDIKSESLVEVKYGNRQVPVKPSNTPSPTSSSTPTPSPTSSSTPTPSPTSSSTPTPSPTSSS